MPPTIEERRRRLRQSAGQALGSPDRGLASRIVADLGRTVALLPRALAAFGSPVHDVIDLAKTAVPGGSAGFDDPERQARTPTLLAEFGKSMGRTVAELPVLLGGGPFPGSGLLDPTGGVALSEGRSYQDFGERSGIELATRYGEFLEREGIQRQETPVLSMVEDLGNISIAGAVGAKPFGMAARSAAGVPSAAPLSRTLRPIKGAPARAKNLDIVRKIAEEAGPGATQARKAVILNDLLGHPYRATWRAASKYRTASGQTVGDVVRNTGLVSSIIEKSPIAAGVLDPEGRAVGRAVQDELREPKRRLRRQTEEAFDPKLAIDDARKSLYAMREHSPELLDDIGIDLPDMPRDLAPDQLASSLRAVREAQEAGAEVPPFADPLQQHRADLTVLTLEAQARGLDDAALVDFIDPLERFGHKAYDFRDAQTRARAAGLGRDEMWEWFGGERYILPERVLGEETGRALSDLDPDVKRARSSYRRWNDPLEEELVSTPSRKNPTSPKIPEEGTRFRLERNAEGEPILDPNTGRFKVRRVAEPDEPVPYEVQGPSKQQGRTLRAQRRQLTSEQRRVARLEEEAATQRAQANEAVFEANRAVARRMENLAKEAVAAGDDPRAARLLDEMGELAAEQERLADAGGLAMPKRLRNARQGVEEALDEVIALASTPALRNMLDPETYTKITNAVENLRGAEEFLDANAERLGFFDALDEVEAAATRARGQRYPGGQPGGRLERAQQVVQVARQQVARSRERAQMLFDPDEAANRLMSAVDRYTKARKPYEETLLKVQTRARERLRRLRNTQRSLETSERHVAELEESILASIEAQPAPVRDLLRLSDQADAMNARLSQLVDDLDLDPRIVDELAMRDLPQDLQQIIAEGYDIGYTRTLADMGDDVTRPTASMGGRVYSEESVAQRQRGGTAPIEGDWRAQLANRVTDVRVGAWRANLANTIDEKFGRTPRELLKSLDPEKLGFDPTDERLARIMELDPHRIERALAREGYTRTDWGALFEGKQKRTGVATFGLDEGQWMRTELYNVLQRQFQSRAYDDFLREWLNPITQGWKNSVLALRPAWHVYSALGNALLATFQGGVKFQDLMDFLPVATEAWRRHRFDYGLAGAGRETIENALGFRGEGAVARASRTLTAPLGRRAARNLEARGIDLENMPDIEPQAREALFEHGITRREITAGDPESKLGEAVRGLPGAERLIATKPWQTGRKLVGKSYRAAALLDDVNRSLVYVTRRLAYGDDIEPALARVVQSLGDYQKLSPFERRYVRSAYPFYTWVRHITGVTLRSLGPDSITRTMILAQVMNIAGQPSDMEQLLPEWAQGDIHVGGDLFLATRGLNPFADVLGPIEHGGRISAMGALSTAHPFIQVPFEQVSGVSTLTGRPFSTPVPRRDPEGRELPTPPPLSEQVVGAVPQLGLARNLMRSVKGETLTRWGTGEPMLIPGVESQPVASKVGQQFGFNIRPLDVEAMRVQKIKNRYAEMRQRMRHEAQQESYNQETGLPLLPSVLGGRG